MQMKIMYFKIRKAVAIIFAIAIAVCCAHHSSFQSVAATAMKNTTVQNTAQMPQVGTKFGRWLDLTFMQLQLDERTEPDAIG